MLLTIVAFTITIVLVYLIRRLSIDYAWTIAIAAGALADMMILLIGDFMFDTNVSILGLIIGTIFAVLITKVVEFFAFHVDYSRTEKVQFEDDEYYYYVKAIPKFNVATENKKVKKVTEASEEETVKKKVKENAANNGKTNNKENKERNINR